MVGIEFYLETQIINTTTGVSMAVRKSLLGGYTYEDLFDTQAALDTGALDKSLVAQKTSQDQLSFLGIKGNKSTPYNTNTFGNSENLGSLLGQTDAIAANKKRKLEQQKMAQNGYGVQQSILGGGAF